MDSVSHLFISVQADLLPRWQEAFPQAKAAAPAGQPVSGVSHAWLRLDADKPLAVQLSTAAKLLPGLPLLILSDTPTDEEGLAVFAAGARAYANTHSNPEVLRQIADVVGQGGLWIGQSLMQRLLTATSNMARAANKPRLDWEGVLTPRELEVARAVANGASNKEIARQMDITERTVKAHVGAILDKLHVRDRLQISLKINGLN